MDKLRIGDQGFAFPMPMTLLGTHVEDRPNFMALGWVSRVNFQPPLLGVGVNHKNRSHDAIIETGQFSVNVPGLDMKDATDYAGLVSGKRTDKSGLFEVFYGELSAAPMIAQCPLSMECRLEQQVPFATNTFFIGQIVSVYSEERYLTDGAPDLEKIRPFVLTMPDNHYWAVGPVVGRAWHDGKALKK